MLIARRSGQLSADSFLVGTERNDYPSRPIDRLLRVFMYIPDKDPAFLGLSRALSKTRSGIHVCPRVNKSPQLSRGREPNIKQKETTLTKTLRLLQLAYACDRRELYWLHSDRNNQPQNKVAASRLRFLEVIYPKTC